MGSKGEQIIKRGEGSVLIWGNCSWWRKEKGDHRKESKLTQTQKKQKSEAAQQGNRGVG